MKVESRYLLAFEDCLEDYVALVGGKSTGLGSMIRAGIPVLPGMAEGPARVILSADGAAGTVKIID